MLGVSCGHYTQHINLIAWLYISACVTNVDWIALFSPHNWGPVRFDLALRSLACRYLCYLFFQLKTHADELAEGGGDEAPALSLFGALAMLTCITLVVATNSEYVSLALCIQALSPSLRQLRIAVMDFSTMQFDQCAMAACWVPYLWSCNVCDSIRQSAPCRFCLHP